MKTLENKTFLISLIVALSVIVVVGVLLLIRFLINKKHFVNAYYKTIYHIAVINDYYLINQFVYNSEEGAQTKIDHILFGDKFIYVISSRLYEGDISGKIDDQSFIFTSRQGKTFYTQNPVLESKTITSSLSFISGLPPEYFIGLTLVNDDCNVGVESNSKQFYIIQRKKLASLIKAIESRPLGKVNEKKLHEAVVIIDKLNEKNKQKNG